MEVLCFGRVVWWWPWCVVCSRLRGPNTEKPPNAAQTRTVFALAFLWFTVVMGVLCDMFASVCVCVFVGKGASTSNIFISCAQNPSKQTTSLSAQRTHGEHTHTAPAA